MDDRFGWCAGCKRTRSEIKAWPTASNEERRAILDNLPSRSAEETRVLGGLDSWPSQNRNN
ncbi:DUF1289 domain-containing protein [Paramagnetospirillum magneticum]|uniref:DUF1289 domain-containing protein n=1 Tax=Paramagnetospirillum magneticum TaxID=84159 RepID=UPI0009FB960B